ncbi:hypothetical protein QBC38DRAFT_444145 [Podospora fimiseda]|uniref:Heterokaryon incompatibility domain-containing protein n=1 Tax=Podospora fimiseda TaxID=252190 RepID=A0AAN7GYB6_9PEZI|nr:hypothetical protein QBC38DRAFT_444145 [Podospora fimiseda]
MSCHMEGAVPVKKDFGNNAADGDRKDHREFGKEEPTDGDQSDHENGLYARLPLPPNGIRILQLLPHPDKRAPIECRLTSVSLGNSELRSRPYEALSYVWGSPANPKQISRREALKKRSQQVQFMAKIYAQAAKFVVWLGEAVDNSDQVLDGMPEATESRINFSADDVLKLFDRPWFQ